MSSASSSNSAVSPPWSPQLDAVIAAPRHHRVILENERVRVLDTRIAPKDIVPVHTHQWPAVHQIVSWSDFVRRDAEGRVLVDTRGRPAPGPLPFTSWGEPLPPHTLENVGDSELHVVSIELKPTAEPLGKLRQNHG